MVLTNDQGVVYHLRASGAPEPVHKEINRLPGISDPLGPIQDGCDAFVVSQRKTATQLAGRMG